MQTLIYMLFNISVKLTYRYEYFPADSNTQCECLTLQEPIRLIVRPLMYTTSMQLDQINALTTIIQTGL